MNINLKSAKTLALALAVATAIPSASLAWDGGDTPDYIVSVSIDSVRSGDNSAGPDDQLCTGFSSMSMSSTVLSSRLERVQRGTENPTIQQRLSAANLSLNFTFEGQRVFNRVTDSPGVYSVLSAWASSYQNLAATVDYNSDGFIDGDDASLANFDSLTYVSEPLAISYDANSCMDSWDTAEVYVERTPVEQRMTSLESGSWWEDIEGDQEVLSDVNLLQSLVAGRSIYGYAYLKRNTQIGGTTFDAEFAEFPYCDDCGDNNNRILSGETGTTTLRAVTRLHGESVEGQFRTRYGFWLVTGLD